MSTARRAAILAAALTVALATTLVVALSAPATASAWQNDSGPRPGRSP